MTAHRLACVVMVSLCLLLLPAAAWAQTVVSGTIAGVARDTTGAVLPGVTVEAASPALIEKVRTVVTDNQGLYRIVDLRPGIYTVTFTLPGFATFRREGIELTTAFTANVNAELKVGAFDETVTVSGASPVVDVQNVMQQKVFSRDFVDALPAGKNINLYATLIPGAVLLDRSRQDVGGSQGEQTQTFSIHGSRPEDFVIMRDGMLVNSLMGSGSRATSMNPGSTQEVVVETGGILAESETGGVQVNIVPKEGGNIFSGNFQTSFGHRDLQSSNVTDELRARGVGARPEIKTLYDVGGGLGGPIKRDKLWFFVGQRWFTTRVYLPGNYFNKLQGTFPPFYEPDLSRPAYSDDYYRESSLRLTWQASQRNKVNLTYVNERNCNCFWGIQTGTLAPEATGDDFYGPQYKAQASWSYPATNRLLFEAGGTVANFTIVRRLTGGTHDDIPVTELSRNYRYGNSGFGHGITTSWGDHKVRQNNQRFAVSYITGSHAFKTGLYMLRGWRIRTSFFDNNDTSYTFLNRVPQSVTFWATPYIADEQQRNVGLYAQDQWTIRRLTLNLGVRFDYVNGWVPERPLAAGAWVPARNFPRVDDVPNWKDVSPRLGAAYDLFGTGKTALKVSLGRYANWENYIVASGSSPVNASVNTGTRTWNDANGDYIPQENELGPLSPANFGQQRLTTRYADDVRTGWGNRGYNWQGAASIQHELRPGIALNVGYFRTWQGNFRVTDNVAVTAADFDPYCITAPVDPRLPGGGGNQICGLYDIKPAKFGQVNNVLSQASGYGKQTQVFNGVDLTINARFGQGGQLSGGLSTGREVTDNCFQNNAPQWQATGGISPTTTTPRLPEFCHVSPPWSAGTQVKFSGVYPLPWGIRPSVTLQNVPGPPITATSVATNAQIAPVLGRNLSAGVRGTAAVEVIPAGTRFEERLTQLDVRLARTFRVGRARVEGQFDVYNMLNANTVLLVNTRYGPAWLNAQQILAARMFKFGAQLNF